MTSGKKKAKHLINKLYPVNDWAFIKVIQENFPDQKINCFIVKKHSNEQDCYNQIHHSLSREMLHHRYCQLFIEQDDRVLASKNLSNRKYAKIFKTDHNTLINAKKSKGNKEKIKDRHLISTLKLKTLMK